MSYALNQLAHSKLLPPPVSAAILADDAPPIPELTEHLLTTTMDAHFMIAGDPQSSWADRRLSHQNLVTAFMLALSLEKTFGPETLSGAGAVSTAPEKGHE
jgi:hypothetical protein